MSTQNESISKALYVSNKEEWRAWLDENSKSAPEVWLLYYKKGSGKPRMAYIDAVEEALCFGWIDGRIRKLDEERYVQRFTPRRAGSRWSALNIERATRMIAEGRMTAAGLEAFKKVESDPARKVPQLPAALPSELAKEFRGNAAAWRNFSRFPPAYQRMTIGWVASAKKEETQRRRLKQLMEFSAANKRIKFI